MTGDFCLYFCQGHNCLGCQIFRDKEVLLMVQPLPAKVEVLCPKCGASIPALQEMLQEPKGTDNWEIATKIIGNCESCMEAMK